jgi:hypothetical protein
VQRSGGRPTGRGVAALTSAARDPAAVAFLAAVVLGGIQAVVLGPAGRILAATVPYLVALVALLAVRITTTAHGTVDAGGSALPGEGWVRAIALAGCGLATWLLVAFGRALPGVAGEEFGFYRVKLQVTSPLGDHNTAAGLLLVAVVAAAVLVARDRRWIAASGLISLGLVATLSRAAVLILVVVVVVAWLLASSRRTTIVLTAAATIAVGGVLGMAAVLDTSPPPPSTGASGPLAEAGSGPLGVSVLGRVDLAVRGVQLGVDHPGLGVGLGRFEDHAADLPAPNDHAHQLLAQAFAEGGIALLLVAAVVPLVLAVRVGRLPRSLLRDLTLLAGLGLVAHAQVEILGGRLGYELLLAVLVGLAAVGRVGAASHPAGP